MMRLLILAGAAVAAAGARPKPTTMSLSRRITKTNSTFAATAQKTFTNLHSELDASMNKFMPSWSLPPAPIVPGSMQVGAIAKWIALNTLMDAVYFRAGMLVVTYTSLITFLLLNQICKQNVVPF